MQLVTENLILCPLEVGHIDAFRRSRRGLGRLLGAAVPEEWPWPETAEILPWLRLQLADEVSPPEWLAWLFIHTASATLIGDGGFSGPPSRAGVTEMGYNILPAFRHCGYGYEAAERLARWAFEQPRTKTLHANTLPAGAASARILRKLGMRRTRTTPDIVCWTLKKGVFLKRHRE